MSITRRFTRWWNGVPPVAASVPLPPLPIMPVEVARPRVPIRRVEMPTDPVRERVMAAYLHGYAKGNSERTWDGFNADLANRNAQLRSKIAALQTELRTLTSTRFIP